MNIVDVLDYLPDAWSENNKAKLVIWGLLLILLLLIAGLIYAVSDLSETVDIQKNNLQRLGNYVDTLHTSISKRDSIDRLKDSLFFSDRERFNESMRKNDERKRKWDADNPKYAPNK